MEKGDIMSGVLERNFTVLKHLVVSREYVYDILLIERVLNEFNVDDAVYLLERYTTKYKSIINEIGAKLTNIIVISKAGVYQEKTEEDLIFDLEYLRDCVLVKASVACGLNNNVDELLNKIVEEVS